MRSIYITTVRSALFILFILFFFHYILIAQSCATTNSVIMGSTDGITTSSVAQSFKLSGCTDGTLENITVFSFSNNTGITLSIFEGEGTGGSELFSATNLSLNAGAPLSNQFSISPAIPFETDDVFTFKFELTSGGSFQLAKSTLVNSYPDGQLYENDTPQANEDLFFIATSSAEALPVELSYFDVQAEQDGVRVYWQTITETNNKGFDLQRSIDGINWSVIGYVEGHSNTSTPIDYTFTDTKPLRGVSFYRLKQIDYDGAFELSDIRSVQWAYYGASHHRSSIYPNPVTKNQLVTLSGFQEQIAAIRLFTSNGQSILLKKIQENEIGNSNEYQFVLPPGLSSGLYVLNIQFANRQSSTTELLWVY